MNNRQNGSATFLRFIYTELPRHTNVTLKGGTFDLFDGHCDGQHRLRTDLRVNVTVLFYVDGDVDVMGSLGENKAYVT